mmetsp:Transcript_526/g.1248  ORF Transcript_526/g.1248 Transcript_526/m.1248 type:complete len:299 (+) Transcript_526:545-1441(+)
MLAVRPGALVTETTEAGFEIPTKVGLTLFPPLLLLFDFIVLLFNFFFLLFLLLLLFLLVLFLVLLLALFLVRLLLLFDLLLLLLLLALVDKHLRLVNVHSGHAIASSRYRAHLRDALWKAGLRRDKKLPTVRRPLESASEPRVEDILAAVVEQSVAEVTVPILTFLFSVQVRIGVVIGDDHQLCVAAMSLDCLHYFLCVAERRQGVCWRVHRDHHGNGGQPRNVLFQETLEDVGAFGLGATTILVRRLQSAEPIAGDRDDGVEQLGRMTTDLVGSEGTHAVARDKHPTCADVVRHLSH